MRSAGAIQGRGAAAWLLSFVLTLTSCGSEDEPRLAGERVVVALPECPELDPSGCSHWQPECQERLWSIAQCLWRTPGEAMPAEPMPTIRTMTPDEYAAAWLEKLPNEGSPELESYEAALAMLGLLSANSLDRETYVKEQVAWLAGVYEGTSKEIVILENDAPGSATFFDFVTTQRQMDAVLVHEFIHALQDRAIGLDSYIQAHSETSDSQWAAQAVVEGQAVWLEMRYVAAGLGLDPNSLDWEAHYTRALTADLQARLSAPEPLHSARRALVYAWGSRWIHSVWKAGAREAVAQLFETPPEHTLGVMGAEFEANEITTAFPSPAPGAEWERVATDRLGAMGAFAAQGSAASGSPELDVEGTVELALSWRGDDLQVFATGEDTLVVWQVEFATESQAETFLSRQRARGSFTRGSSLLDRRGARVIIAGTLSSRVLNWETIGL